MRSERLAVLLGDLAAFRGLLDRQRDAPPSGVELDDLDPQLLAGRDHLVRRLDVVGGQLGDVHETLDAVAHLHEGAEGHHLGDAAVDQLVDRVALGEHLPGVRLGGLERQGDALLGEVDVQYLDVDLVADGDDLAGVVDVLPAEFRDVDEPVHAAEVHEGTEVDDRRDDAMTALAGLEVVQEVASLLLLGLLEPRATRQHDVVAVAVELDDLRLDGLADVGLELAHAAQLDQ